MFSWLWQLLLCPLKYICYCCCRENPGEDKFSYRKVAQVDSNGGGQRNYVTATAPKPQSSSTSYVINIDPPASLRSAAWPQNGVAYNTRSPAIHRICASPRNQVVPLGSQPIPDLAMYTGSMSAFIKAYLQPTQEYTANIKKVIHLLAEFMKQRTNFSVAKVFVGGPMKKGTHVKGFSDLDIILFLNDFQSMDDVYYNMPSILYQLGTIIGPWHDRSSGWKVESVESAKFVLKTKLTCCGEYLSIDILPAFDNLQYKGKEAVYAEMDSVSEEDSRFYSSSFAPLQCEWVIDKTKGLPHLRNLIRLVKYWRKEYLPDTKGYPTSYLLELLTIRTWESVGSPQNEFWMEKAFKRVLWQMVNYEKINMGCRDNYDRSNYEYAERRESGGPFIMDPANPFNNVCCQCKCWDEVARAATDTMTIPALKNVYEVYGGWEKYMR